MKRVFKYVWKHRWLVFIPIVAMIIAIALDMFNPYLSGLFINRDIKTNTYSTYYYNNLKSSTWIYKGVYL